MKHFAEENDSLKQKVYELNSELYRRVNELNDYKCEFERDQNRFELELKKEKEKNCRLADKVKRQEEQLEVIDDKLSERNEQEQNLMKLELASRIESEHQKNLENKMKQIAELKAKIAQLESFNFSRRAFVDFEIESEKLSKRNVKVSLLNEVLQHFIRNQSDHADTILRGMNR